MGLARQLEHGYVRGQLEASTARTRSSLPRRGSRVGIPSSALDINPAPDLSEDLFAHHPTMAQKL